MHVGMAVGDSIGHPLEFLDVADPGESQSAYSLQTHSYTKPFNKFGLSPGQWTDDCAMGLCLADSLLAASTFDGADCRVRFWSWWFCGMNNAFRKDASRHGSVGLGGNISRSLYTMRPGEKVSPAFRAEGSDAGNGSLMRLAAVPIAFWRDAAASVARASSLTTHPGPIAAAACAYLATLIAKALNNERRPGESARSFLERVADVYIDSEVADDCEASQLMRRLLRSAEPGVSLERCWNWRATSLDLRGTMERRGAVYNGYPNSAGYFGSFCLDGLAMALFAVAQTDSFGGAIELCVNLCGDADSTGAICGQIAGATYGWRAIPEVWRADLHRWDEGEVALRAALLVAEPPDACSRAIW